eukprot:6214200-Pleurochrysis_carterae.AAC.3
MTGLGVCSAVSAEAQPSSSGSSSGDSSDIVSSVAPTRVNWDRRVRYASCRIPCDALSFKIWLVWDILQAGSAQDFLGLDYSLSCLT